MCGRYVSPDEASIEREFNLVHHEWQFPMSYNVAPTQSVPVVRIAADGERTGVLMHWGLIPYWAKGIQPKYSTINATVEKLTEAAQAVPRYASRRDAGQHAGKSPGLGVMFGSNADAATITEDTRTAE